MPSITERAMLVSLTIEKWSARKHDRGISDEVADTHAAGERSDEIGRYNKILLPKSALRDIDRIANEARTHHYANTLAWDDEGWRILPADNYFSYAGAQGGFRRQFQDAVIDFRNSYMTHKDAARVRLGDMFAESDYPGSDDIARRFGFSMKVQPLPTAADFRVHLGDETEARIRRTIERRLSDATDAAMRDLWQRVHASVSHMAERLAGYTPGERTGTFKDSLVGNLRDLADLLPRLNVTGDGELAAVHTRLVAELCRHDAQVLRDDPVARTETAGAANDILKRMAGYTAAA